MPEPVVREPLCRCSFCPERSNPDWHVCIVCEQPATEHAHVLSRALRPDLKADPDNIVCLCVKHHRAVDQHHEWHAVVYLPDKTYIRGKQGSPTVTFEKKMQPAQPNVPSMGQPDGAVGGRGESDGLTIPGPIIPSLAADWSGYTDEQLAAIYQTAERAHGGAFLCMCKAVWQYRENHERHWGTSWIEAAYSLFGSIPSRRTLEGYAGFWEVCVTSVADTEQVSVIAGSRSLIQLIGRARKGDSAPVLLEAAVDYAAEYGEAPSVPALLQKVGVESGERAKVVRYTVAELRGLTRAWEGDSRACPWPATEYIVGTNYFLHWLEEREKSA